MKLKAKPIQMLLVDLFSLLLFLSNSPDLGEVQTCFPVEITFLGIRNLLDPWAFHDFQGTVMLFGVFFFFQRWICCIFLLGNDKDFVLNVA